MLALDPGQEMEPDAYAMAEEAMLCLEGEGEVFVRGRWAAFAPGDFAFSAAGRGAVRAAPGGPGLVVVTQISAPVRALTPTPASQQPPVRRHGPRRDLLRPVQRRAGTLTGPSQLADRDTEPDVRPGTSPVDEVRTGGALFNVFRGAKIDVIDAPMVFVTWPAFGVRATGFHFANGEDGLTTSLHAHPGSDECVVLWDGQARAWAVDGWHDMEMYDVVMAPCGVKHGVSAAEGAARWGGFAAPPQMDLYARTLFYQGTGTFGDIPFGHLDD